jgi:hypothetical protein
MNGYAYANGDAEQTLVRQTVGRSSPAQRHIAIAAGRAMLVGAEDPRSSTGPRPSHPKTPMPNPPLSQIPSAHFIADFHMAAKAYKEDLGEAQPKAFASGRLIALSSGDPGHFEEIAREAEATAVEPGLAAAVLALFIDLSARQPPPSGNPSP